MKVTDYETRVVQGNVWPHSGKGNHGPHDVRISVHNLPAIIPTWGGKWVLFNVDQPNEGDNFTLLRFMFLKPGTRTPSLVAGLKFHRIRKYQIKDGGVKASIKTRYTRSLPHPLPKGSYSGTVAFDTDQRFAVITLQATTLKKEPEPSTPKTIITPGDPQYGESLAKIKRAVL